MKIHYLQLYQNHPKNGIKVTPQGINANSNSISFKMYGNLNENGQKDVLKDTQLTKVYYDYNDQLEFQKFIVTFLNNNAPF